MRRSVFVALLPLVGACFSIHPYALPPVRDSATRNELARHAIFVDNAGRGIEPRVGESGQKLDGPNYYEAYVHVIMDGIRSHRDSGYPDVLIRIHGGLNTLRESPPTVSRMDAAIARDTASKIYPLFINWDSGILESYGDHLFFVHQGRRHSFNPFGATFYLAADFGKAVTRLPIVWWGQFARTMACAGTDDVPPRPDPNAVKIRLTPSDSALQAYLAKNDCGITGAFESDLYSFEDSLKAQDSLQAKNRAQQASSARIPVVSRFAYHRSGWELWRYYGTSSALSLIPMRTLWSLGGRLAKGHESIWAPVIPRKTTNPRGRVARSVVNAASWLPLKVFGLMLLDAIGTPGWENMRRRTKTMFQQPYSANEFSREGPVAPKPGAAAILFDSLQSLQLYGTGKFDTPVRITLIGHSMGAIIANEALRTHDSLEVANVVFMAGALSLRDFQLGTLPYLRRHESTQFYNLTLHPLSDLRESAFLGFAPYGSLLAWLDGYLDHPESELDRVMGKYQNTTEAAAIIKGDVRARVHLKAFGYRDSTGCGDKGLPYKHGHFNEPGVPYWKPAFWAPGAPCPDAPHRATARSLARPVR